MRQPVKLSYYMTDKLCKFGSLRAFIFQFFFNYFNPLREIFV